MYRLGIFGLGYVGTEVARLGLQREYPVSAYDIDEELVTEINERGLTPQDDPSDITATTDPSEVIDRSDVLVVTVPTPLDSSHAVDLSPLQQATSTIAKRLAASQGDQPPLVVVESTVPPGTVRTVVTPLFEEYDLVVGSDLYIAHVPERIDPGNDEWPLEELPRVVGAVTKDGLETAARFYEDFLDASVHRVETPAVAESAKIIENAFRDINIAFANEIAVSLDNLNIDAVSAFEAAATKPFGFMEFSPGAGVGGHCIPVDPYLLIGQATRSGFDHRFLKIAREVNDSMPRYVVEKTVKGLNSEGILPKEADVLILGAAFKPGVDDTRNSPYYAVRSELRTYGCTVETYDPRVDAESTVDSPYTSADAVVLVTAHPEFARLDAERLAESGVSLFVDGRNAVDPKRIETAGVRYIGVGR